jgi:transcriptional regulator with XRE-family HTH domain
MTRERGQRLEQYMRELLPPDADRSRSELARRTGVSRQQLIQWFDGKGEPRLSALEDAAAALGVRRVDLVAAYDGVTVPEQRETPPPDWAGALARMAAEETVRRVADLPVLLDAVERLRVQLEAIQQPPHEAPHEGAASRDQDG